MKAAAAVGVASPCVSLCQMHAATGWCQGCLRTLDEIAAWGGLDDRSRRLVLQQLRARRVAWRALVATAGTDAATLATAATTAATPGPSAAP